MSFGVWTQANAASGSSGLHPLDVAKRTPAIDQDRGSA
jgi:hypothetical protein